MGRDLNNMSTIIRELKKIKNVKTTQLSYFLETGRNKRWGQCSCNQLQRTFVKKYLNSNRGILVRLDFSRNSNLIILINKRSNLNMVYIQVSHCSKKLIRNTA